MTNAIGKSPVAITAFGLTTAANYAFLGLVNWLLEVYFIVGRVAGGYGGTLLASRLLEGERLRMLSLGTLSSSRSASFGKAGRISEWRGKG